MMAQAEKIEGPKAHEIANDVMIVSRFVTFLDDNEIWIEREGVLEPDGDKLIKAAVEKAVPDASDHFKNEVIAHVRDRTRQERGKLDAESWPFLAVKNGVLDIRVTPPVFWTFEDFKHAYPKIFLFNKLPVEFQYGATAPEFLKFLHELAPSHDTRIRLLDQFASILDRRPDRKQRCLMLVGPPNAGKTTYLNVEAVITGSRNVSGVSLQSLTDGTDRFAKAALYGKMLNVCGDLTEIPLKSLGDFKDLTGGGVVRGQRKGQDGFEFHNHAKLHFAANVPPGVKNITDRAFWDRWDYIETENERKDGEFDPELLTKLTEPHELSGILNILLGVLARQIKTGRFYFPSSPEETQASWLGQTEPARAFLMESVFTDPNAKLPKRSLIAAWESWRSARKARRITTTRLNELVAETFNAQAGTAKVGKMAVKVWFGINLKDGNNAELEEFRLPELPVSTIASYYGGGGGGGGGGESPETVTSVTRGIKALFGGRA